MSRHKKRVEVPDDTGDAQIIQQEAQNELRELRSQAPLISAIADKLARRRNQNHFGEEIQITFKPRGSRT